MSQNKGESGCVPTNLKALIHPLVVMQISEHFSRLRVQEKVQDLRVYGAVLGRQSGRTVEMINSFAFKMYTDETTGRESFNLAHFEARARQYAEVFPEISVVGVYCTGSEAELIEVDRNVLTTFSQLKATDSPVLLKMNTATGGNDRRLPLYVFEGDSSATEEKPGNLAIAEWQLILENSERVGVNHIAKLSTKDGQETGSANAKQYRSQKSAIDMLVSRIELILAYLAEVEAGRLPIDLEILREANLLTQRLRMMVRHATEYKNEFDKEEKELTIYSLLPKITSLMGAYAQVGAKLSIARYEATYPTAGISAPRGAYNAFAKQLPRMVAFPGTEDDDEEEEEESERGPRRKIHAADSPAISSSTTPPLSDRTPPPALDLLSATSSSPTSEDPTAIPAAAAATDVPDAPMPSASSAATSSDV
ncbi:unnamed protein product [Caenorhabditis auriculariae]|uniref:COP9 signalosome complex subunit 6 n=1 Tax=Caenorhabditis auriculariae TaxID=2777116 RepID=A0A8S1H8H4_9PELO|nr:unnamed protein product [Caenorhabditis auriculariae]